MAYIKFLDSDTLIKGFVIPENEHVITLNFEGEPEINLSGFDLYLDNEKEVDIGGGFYRDFKTLYRNDDICYQLSNDGSIYVEPEPIPDPEISEPTIDELKREKIAEMEMRQQDMIANGVDVILSDGSSEHFTLKDQDQISLIGLQALALQGKNRIPWHGDDEEVHCKYYDSEDMKLITSKALSYVTYQVTYFRDLRIYINSMKDKDSIQSVEYGTYIPQEFQSEVLADLYAARNA